MFPLFARASNALHGKFPHCDTFYYYKKAKLSVIIFNKSKKKFDIVQVTVGEREGGGGIL